eukprot:8616311-Pyramimonas_sp.AAC.2
MIVDPRVSRFWYYLPSRAVRRRACSCEEESGDGQRSLRGGRAQNHACKGCLEQCKAALVQGLPQSDPRTLRGAGGGIRGFTAVRSVESLWVASVSDEDF